MFLSRLFRIFIEPSLIYWASVGIAAGILRREYVQKAADLDKGINPQQADSTQVVKIIQQRNALKDEIRNDGNDLIEKMAESRNLKKYGNELGPDYNYLYQKMREKHPDWTPEQLRAEIVAGATRTNEAASEGASTLEYIGYGLLAVLLLRLIISVWRSAKGEGFLNAFHILSCWLMGFIGAMLGLVLTVENVSEQHLVWAAVAAAAGTGAIFVLVWDLIFGFFVSVLNKDLAELRKKRGF